MSAAELGLKLGLDSNILFNRGRSTLNGHKEKGDARRSFKRNIGSKTKKNIETSVRRVKRVLRQGK